MKKILLLLSVLCIAVACTSCLGRGDDSSGTASQGGYVEDDSDLTDDESGNSIGQGSGSTGDGNGTDDSISDDSDKWADIEFPRP